MTGARNIWISREEDYQIEKFCRDHNHMKDGKPEYSRGIRLLIDIASRESTTEAEALRLVIQKYRDELYQVQEEIIKLRVQLLKESTVPLIEE